ncbi:UDP-glycosyltransferase 74F2 [Striga hermonthica]|uniref:Glycosyltransferase n=1 Tax=Striga hermonthica TaxID=68872 RepID=A0A9N7NMS0_STRHE|nr:UDP-glycosyltransferase 74F2 [Striga hermonthica]
MAKVNKSGLAGGAHILVIPYPSQGHVNPMHQFCKRLAFKGAKPTLVITKFISKTFDPKSTHLVAIDTISDGFDQGGFGQSEGVEDYLTRLEIEGSRSLEHLVKSYQSSSRPIDWVVYDAFLPWALDVAKKHDIKSASFFTQACMVNYVYYYICEGVLKLPVTTPPAVELPGLPPLELADMPSFVCVPGSYPDYFKLVLGQFRDVEKADLVLVNTYHKLEVEALESMSKVFPILTIGPTLPSFYLDNRVPNDRTYDINLFESNSSATIANWLDAKQPGSVVYVAFGSMVDLSRAQTEEIARGLIASGFGFLWVLRESDSKELELARGAHDRSLVVQWSPQLEVLSHVAVGCFFSHGGWNSTAEALSLGVPMVVFPQWTDQTTNAKLVQDVWGVGLRVCVGPDGIVGRDEIERCVREVMEGEKGKEMKRNACKWRELAKEAVSEGGTSDVNIDYFIAQLSTYSSS